LRAHVLELPPKLVSFRCGIGQRVLKLLYALREGLDARPRRLQRLTLGGQLGAQPLGLDFCRGSHFLHLDRVRRDGALESGRVLLIQTLDRLVPAGSPLDRHGLRLAQLGLVLPGLGLFLGAYECRARLFELHGERAHARLRTVSASLVGVLVSP